MLPYYPFYWADYSSKTYELTQGQHGAFILFLRHIYTTGLPIPDKQMFSIARALLEQEKENATFVLETYFTMKGDVWVQKRAFEIIEEQNKKHQARVIAGKKGGKQKSSNAKFLLQAKPKQPEPEPESNTPLTPQGGNGVFKIEKFLTAQAIEAARREAPGWDVYHLMRVYDEGIPKRGMPRKPNDAFPEWCARYTKGKTPEGATV